jgi:hypothetical protein
MRRLFQFSTVVWRASLEDEGPKLVMEKGLASNDGVERLGLRLGSQTGLKSMGKVIRPKT